MRLHNFYIILLMGCIIGFSGCDLINSSDEDDNNNDQEIEGLWELTTNNETTYVLIEEQTITVHTQESGIDCFFIEVLDIVSVEDDVYTLSEPATQENIEVTIVRENDQIRVTRMEDGETIEEVFEMSDEDVSSLTPECEETIAGLWQLDSDQGDILYVLIDLDNDKIGRADFRGDAHNEGPDCYEFQEYNITNIDGNDYTLENVENTNDTVQVTLELIDGDLQATLEDDGQQVVETYFRSNEDPESFGPACS